MKETEQFQFHSGSIQTRLPNAPPTNPPAGFQFHSGSIQTESIYKCRITKSEFQFHSGSIQTWTEEPKSLFWRYVSIPLWFDSNL